MAMRYTCPHCGKAYKFPEELAGKRIKCRKCGQKLDLPALNPAAKRPATDRSARGGAEDYQLVDLPDDEKKETSSTLRNQHADFFAEDAPDYELDVVEKREKSCPSCNVVLEEEVIICVRCGFNFETGAKVPSEVAPRRGKKKKFLFWQWHSKKKPSKGSGAQASQQQDQDKSRQQPSEAQKPKPR